MATAMRLPVRKFSVKNNLSAGSNKKTGFMGSLFFFMPSR